MLKDKREWSAFADFYTTFEISKLSEAVIRRKYVTFRLCGKMRVGDQCDFFNLINDMAVDKTDEDSSFRHF